MTSLPLTNIIALGLYKVNETNGDRIIILFDELLIQIFLTWNS